MPLPGNLLHSWIFDLELTTTSVQRKEVHRCQYCKVWSDDPNLEEACPNRDRRKGQRRKFAERRNRVIPSSAS